MAKRKHPATSPKETRRWIRESDLEVICQAWHDYEGDTPIFASAAGALIVGRLMGYDGLKVMHSWRTLRKYEAVLGIKFDEVLEARTKDSRRLNGIRYAESFQAFWKAIAGGVAQMPDAKKSLREITE